MKNLHRLVWWKGMFLSPQNFQAQDRHSEDSLNFRLAAAQQYYWGFTGLELDATALEKKSAVAIQRGSGVMPDGTPFDFPGSDWTPASRSLEGYFPSSVTDLDIFLAVPEQKEKERNFAPLSANGENAASAAGIRYLVEEAQFSDESHPGETKTVRYARPNLSILFGTESTAGYETLRVARLYRDQGGLPAFRADFIPPMLSVGASTYLRRFIDWAVSVLSGQHDSLSASRKERGKGLGEFNVSDTGLFWLLHIINTYLPQLKHIQDGLREDNGFHPEPLYLMLLGLVGGLTTFNPIVDPKTLPRYDHNIPGPPFTKLQEYLDQLLRTVIPSKYIQVPLEKTAVSTIQTGSIKDKSWLDKTQFYLVVDASGESSRDLADAVARLVKIAGKSKIDAIRTSIIPALQLIPDIAPPQTMPIRATALYFRFDQNERSPHWQDIVREMSFGIHIPPELQKYSMEILISLP